MSDEDRTVTLGGQPYVIAPIDLGTLKVIGMGSARMQSAPPSADAVVKEAGWYEGTFQVLAAALKKPMEDILKIENVTLQELLTANRKILMVTGLAVVPAKTTTNSNGVPKPPGESEGAAVG